MDLKQGSRERERERATSALLVKGRIIRRFSGGSNLVSHTLSFVLATALFSSFPGHPEFLSLYRGPVAGEELGLSSP